MKQVTVTELKNKLSQYLRLVKRGETVEVLEHSVPIARLQGIDRDQTGDNALLDQLIREGIVTRARRKPTRAWLKNAPVKCKGDAVRILTEQRGDR
jgi:prevent-host-death family protein